MPRDEVQGDHCFHIADTAGQEKQPDILNTSYLCDSSLGVKKKIRRLKKIRGLILRKATGATPTTAQEALQGIGHLHNSILSDLPKY